MIFLLTILYFLAMILCQKGHLNDMRVFSFNRVSRDTSWKSWENVRKFFFFAGIAVFQIPWVKIHFPFHWKDLVLAIGFSIPFFELGTNKIGLHAKWFYNGKSSEADKLGIWKWILVFALFGISIYLYFKM